MGNPPLQQGNKIYTLKPKLITNLQDYFRKVKLKWYKKKKINNSKTPHQRFYHMKFKINIKDDINPQILETVYEMVVPARAYFFANIFLKRSIKQKIEVDVVDWEEMSDEEVEQFLETQTEFPSNQKKQLPECNHTWVRVGRDVENRFHCTDCHDEQNVDI